MKKSLLLLFAGLVLSSVSLGCFMKTPAPLKADASPKQLELDADKKITLGSFPINYDGDFTEQFFSGQVDENDFIEVGGIDGATVYDHKGSNVLVKGDIQSDSSNEVEATYQLTYGYTISEAKQYPAAFYKGKELKWSLLEKSKDYYDFILDTIFFRSTFNDSNNNEMKYGDSKLFRILNDEFYHIAFSDEENIYLSLVSEDEKENAYITLPSQSQIKKSEPECVAGDLAILSNLSAKDGYAHAPYWTKTSAGGDRKVVRWFDKEYTNCLLTDPKIGIRPVIRISTKLIKGATSGGGGTSTPTSANVPLIIGIITGVLGIGALIAFFMMWSKKLKKDPTFKMPGWYYAIIFVITITCCVSIITITTGTTGGGSIGCSFKTGYYLQSTPKSSSGNAVQVGLNCYRFNSDGTVNFCAACETADASDFWADSGNGTWKANGCTLYVTYNSYYGTNSFKLTISGTKLYYGNTEAYHWVRGE